MSDRLTTLMALACVPCLVAFAVEPAPLPPFIVTGRVVDYDGAGLKTAEVRVRKAGTLLARSKVGAFEDDTPCTYAVSVPMSRATAGVTTSTVGVVTVGATGAYDVDELVDVE